jgi:TPR repeat protein
VIITSLEMCEMILRLLVAAIVLTLLAPLAMAQSTAAHRCDELAGHPWEPGHEDRDIGIGDVEVVSAIAACRAALVESPESPEILYRLARTLMQVEQYSEALPMLLRAAEAGYAPAQTAYGTVYFGSQTLAPNYSTARYWLARAADAGHAVAQYNLATMYSQSIGTQADYPRAAALYELAAAQGFAPAMINLGLIYERGEAGVPQDWEASFALFTRAAELGMPTAIHAVGRAYSEGHGTARDAEAAFEWWQRSAAAGYTPALVDIARALLSGQGVEPDRIAAIERYRQSAAAGYTVAQIDLGRLLADSIDPAEKAEGVDWMKRAGEAGDLEGYQYLAEHYALLNQLPLARHYADIVAANGDDQLREFARSLLATLDGLEARRRKTEAAEASP